MLEWYQPYNTFVTPGLDQAGGVNIAENQTVYAPILKPRIRRRTKPRRNHRNDRQPNS
jgi:hypothetical protein